MKYKHDDNTSENTQLNFTYLKSNPTIKFRLLNS